MRCQTAITVGPSDIDELGHVNNARFLDFLERGRMGWYARQGFRQGPDGDAEHRTLGTVVVNVNIDYHRECFAGERIVVETWPGSRGTRSFRLAQRILNASSEVAASAVVTSVVMNRATRRTVDLPAALVAALPPPLSP